MNYDSSSSSFSEDEESLYSLQSLCIDESFLTVTALIAAVNEQIKKQSYAVVRCQSTKEKKEKIVRVYLHCNKEAICRQYSPLQDSKKCCTTSTHMIECSFEVMTH